MSSRIRLGAFILGALIIFFMLVFWIGDKQFVFSRTYLLRASFDNVAGLDEGAPVRAGGVRIGTVQRIELPHQPGDKIIVEMDLEKSSREVIKKDSIASIETEGLLGAKYAAVSFGSAEAEQVHDGDTIESRPPFDYGELARNLGELIGTAKEAVDSSKIAIGNINEASGDMKSIADKINSGQGTVGALVNDRTVYRNLNATIAQAQAGMASFQDNMEALSHNFFLKGFFKNRGYFDSSELTKHAVTRLPSNAQSVRARGRCGEHRPERIEGREPKALRSKGNGRAELSGQEVQGRRQPHQDNGNRRKQPGGDRSRSSHDSRLSRRRGPSRPSGEIQVRSRRVQVDAAAAHAAR